MDKNEAKQRLGIASTDREAVEAAHREKRAALEQKRDQAPTDALKEKFDGLIAQLDEARDVLLADKSETASSASSSTPSRPSSLSETKVADLPQAQASHTGFDDGGQPGAGVQLEPGTVLASRYEIIERIGEGGMGAVYRAHDRNTGRDLALKVLLPALLRNERARERFLNEARLSQELSHPNIANVHDVQHEGNFYFLTMELLEGQDLRQIMENRQVARQSFSEKELIELARTLCDALRYAHQHTVHRDIKPENIWVTEQGEYKLMDFGIARVQSTSQRTQTGAAMGTAYYMAPEQLKGQAQIDGRADQYAVAVMLYELATGDVPAGVIKPLREKRKDLSKGFAAAVMKALQAEPEDRHADMAAFAEALQGKGGGFSLPDLPWQGVGIAVGVLIAVVGLGAAVGTGGLDLASLLPMSAEEKSEYKARIARVQGEVKVLKQRLQNARRSLESELRDAERNGADNLEKLRFWRQVTEDVIFNGERIAELEGEQSVADSLLRDEQFAKAEQAARSVLQGYQELNASFKKIEELYLVRKQAESARDKWKSRVREYRISVASPSAEEARERMDNAKAAQRTGDLQAAADGYKGAREAWMAAPSDKGVAARIEAVEKERAQRLERKRKEEEQRRFNNGLSMEVGGVKFRMEGIPGGTFKMGDRSGHESGSPIHEVQVSDFYMMQHEVTFKMWDTCVASGECSHRPGDHGWGRGSRPVSDVSWVHVKEQFIPWINRRTGKEFRLPTEAEWEYAARAGSQQPYSWGGKVGKNRANCDGCGTRWNGKKTAPVKSFEPNAFGLYDMHGNAWEWVEDCSSKNYRNAPNDGSAWVSEDCGARVLRGGSYMAGPGGITAGSRVGFKSTASPASGFRLALDR